jgi:hypothetical protein
VDQAERGNSDKLANGGLAVEAKRAATISRVCATDLFGFPQRFARSAGVKDD